MTTLMGRITSGDVTLALAAALALASAVASFDRMRLEQMAVAFVSAHDHAEAVTQGSDATQFDVGDGEMQ